MSRTFNIYMPRDYMGKIVVNTEQLRKQARDIQRASDDLRAVSGQLSVLINSVNHDAYDGQLTQRIREILGGVESRAGQLAGGLSELQKELNRRAALFDEANRKTLQCIVPLTLTFDQVTGDVRNPPPSIEGYSSITSSSKPIAVKLDDKVKPEDYPGEFDCVLYAQKRRHDLGLAGGGAANYIGIYKDRIFQTGPTDDLTTKIAKGYALVWPRGEGGAGPDGHVAIIEEVHETYIVVSHAGWKTGEDGSEFRSEFSREDVSQLYVIP